jgi:hypothetical protein
MIEAIRVRNSLPTPDDLPEWARFWEGVMTLAGTEANRSPLTGYTDGPADAYRHIIGAAEMRRRFGLVIAATVVQGNEVVGTHVRGNPSDGRRMDDHNNAIGMRIGLQAKTYDDVVRLARSAILDGFERGGTGDGNSPIWLGNGNEPPRWDRSHVRPEAPPRDWPFQPVDRRDYNQGDERHRFLPDRTGSADLEQRRFDRLAATPVADWAERDVRAVIGSRAYRDRTHPDHAAWQDRVRRYFVERQRDAECGGETAVRGHTRQGPSGPIQVRPHRRTVACD